MSKEEKRNVVLGIYYKSKSVFTEKEIHALAAKSGINANTIPEINQSLVDDGLVEKEKIGGSNYFWSFPAKKDRMMQTQHEKRVRNIEQLKQQRAQSLIQLADAKRGRDDEDEEDSKLSSSRSSKLARLESLEKERKDTEIELARLKDNDPQALADLEKELRLMTNAANRWTDNIFACKKYLTKKRGMDKKEANRILGVTANFDYPEDTIPK